MRPSSWLLYNVGGISLNFSGMLMWAFLKGWPMVLVHGVLLYLSLNQIFKLGELLDKESEDEK